MISAMESNDHFRLHACKYFEQNNKSLNNQRDEAKNALIESDDNVNTINTRIMFIENYNFDETEFPIKGILLFID